ncbi:ribonuclease H-like protein [Fomitopsis serialis]|uniref:ribonuclease H-like protein n=1 Tax=Fomitopsis serialis TaxID=139415 RepID=UPI002008A3A9|nr:ribonuclease H-like protein [Neoantrodia serialis]KAH9938182.1 ribonuclease H-like protein [Neoantrodia serialis]
MFPTKGLFAALPCPDRPACRRSVCLFSHAPDARESFSVHIPVDAPKEAPVASSAAVQPKTAMSVPAKRPIPSAAAGTSTPEPPRKLQRTGPTKRPVAVPTATHTASGVPLIRVPPAQSQVAIPVRQAMLQQLFQHYLILYENILAQNPTLASEHALRQEEEVYQKSNKLTYRNAVISSIVTLKQRQKPNGASHPSVGTEGDLARRAEERKKLNALRLTAKQLEPYVLSLDQLRKWGHIVDIPASEGGSRPSEEGSVKTCDRCSTAFKVKRREEASMDECVYHWGKAFSTKTNGEKRRLFTCCSRPSDSEGCQRGPHVFYETSAEDLHVRHPFSYTRGSGPPDEVREDGHSTQADIEADTTLDIVALDCEMVYTTGGMRVARVSVVDSTGKEVFDELVKMDDGVDVIDYNTRFSGITAEAHAAALLPLTAIRRSLDALISSKRMVHHRCIDTVVLFPHQAGPPYRRALRALVKEHLGQTIQEGGGTVGHSSVEDSVATLDLVRWHVLNRPHQRPNPQLLQPQQPRTSYDRRFPLSISVSTVLYL